MYTFDDARREITFDRYNTPTPWMNYLSNGVFHTMISHCGGGVAFYKSPRYGASIIIAFFTCRRTEAAFYTYIRDGKRRLDADKRAVPHKAGTVALHARDGIYAL